MRRPAGTSIMFASRLVLTLSLPALGLCDSWFDCVPGISGSIGVSTPRGDISLKVGAEPVELFCHLNPNDTYYSQQGYDADNLLMKIKGRAGSETIMKDQKMNSTRVNSTTIRTSFSPTTVGLFDIRCRLAIKKKDKLDRSDSGETEQKEEKGVCWQKIHVGYPPLPVRNFSCISENWSNLNCTWVEQFNPVRTQYKLHYVEPGRYRSVSSPLIFRPIWLFNGLEYPPSPFNGDHYVSKFQYFLQLQTTKMLIFFFSTSFG